MSPFATTGGFCIEVVPCFHYGFAVACRVATVPPVLFVAFSGPWLSQFSIWLRPSGLLCWTIAQLHCRLLGLLTFPGTFLSLKGLALVRHESTWQISCQGHTVSEEIGGARGLVKRAARVSVCIHFPASPMAALAEGAIAVCWLLWPCSEFALIWSHADSKSQPCIPCTFVSIAVAS
ncbi:unnamed protein product [Effrenium voratum]|uniref:Uncharacterized protein n=1 Tax=Effrenium voratum TaxID=2562239 RepID=A0AA36J6C1_9DINO|nr:unnamed protein product [Effrenium voratum]CAJ1433156.1 unnamed protein product [Effrenium voratum]CAJ1460958.1 unnamed protein product [Effrenium voratum]